MTMKNRIISFALLAFTGIIVSGCNATNDNPISPEKMSSIRKKEAEGRANFNPGGGPPGAPASGAPAPGK